MQADEASGRRKCPCGSCHGSVPLMSAAGRLPRLAMVKLDLDVPDTHNASFATFIYDIHPRPVQGPSGGHRRRAADRCRSPSDQEGCGAVGTRRVMYQAPTMPAATIAARTVTLSRRKITLIEIAMAIIETADTLARIGIPSPER